MDSLIQDVRYACRVLVARPGWTAAAMLCLAIATGANTAAFTLVNGLLLRPLPFAEPDRLVMVALREPSREVTRPFALREYRELAEAAADTAALLARTFFPLSLSADDGAAMAQTELVSGNYFEVLRVVPFAGRFFDARADRARGEQVAVVSHALWRRRFGADPAIIGRTVRVNGRPVVIAGVAPPGFVGATQLVAADLWLPAALYADLTGSADADHVPMFGVMGRLAPTTRIEETERRLATIAAAQMRTRGASQAPAVVVTPAAGFGVPPVARGTVLGVSGLVFGLMALLMAVASANVAALVLARGVGRTREIGVRLTLGAGRVRVARQFLTESLVLATAGSAAGTVVGIWLTGALVERLATGFSYVTYAIDVRPDAGVFVYSAIATAAATLLCGLAPVRHATRLDIVEVLRQAAPTASPHAAMRTLNAMVVTQVAVSMPLLAGAGLLVRTYADAQSIQPGFNTKGLIAASLDAGQARLDETSGRRFYQDVFERLSTLPGVTGVALAQDAPFAPGARSVPARAVADAGGSRKADAFQADETVISASYFRTVGVPLIHGRGFAAVEPARPPVAIVNETMAKQLSPEGFPVGRTFAVGDEPSERIEVIGVVADTRDRLRAEGPRAVFYRPFSQQYSARMTIVMRVQTDPGRSLDAVRKAIGDLSPDLAIVELRTVDQQRDAALARRRDPAAALTIACLVGLLLTTVGLYGVTTYGVRQRVRELGIRLALGARPADVRRLVLRQGLGVVGAGMAAGAAASIVVAHAMRRLLFGVAAWDPFTVATVCGILLVTALTALYVPARWASRLEPGHTLRSE